MNKELDKDISLTEELLNNLPVNNPKNIKRFMKEVDSEIAAYQKKADEIMDELKSRLTKYENMTYENMVDTSSSLNQLKKGIIYTSDLSTSLEKLKLDKIIYQLTHYEDDDLINNNRKILRTINIYKTANIPLTINDFNYTKFVSDYMQMFFEPNLTTVKIKRVFDNIYWKCPNIITQIELNIRQICQKYYGKTEGYINSINKQINERFKKAQRSILDDYNYLKLKTDNNVSKNNLTIDFYSQKLDINEYTDEKISDITSKLFKNNDYDDSKIKIVMQLLNSVKEYKNYLKYKDLILKVKTLYGETLEKDFKNKTLKKIKDLEHKLIKLNKKFNNNASNTSVDKLEPEINSIILEIKNAYNELDSNMFKIIVKEHIKENSTIFKSLLLLCQHYSVLADYFKEKEPDLKYSDIDKNIDELLDFAIDPNNTMINNLTVLDEQEVSDIIVTNYRMLNINIDESSISEAELDNLISNLEKIIINYRLRILNISIKDLQDAKSIKNIIDNN